MGTQFSSVSGTTMMIRSDLNLEEYLKELFWESTNEGSDIYPNRHVMKKLIILSSK